nr:immunoglobulin light chain junction region [Macaca mulatta]
DYYCCSYMSGSAWVF